MSSKYALPKNGGLVADVAVKELAQRYEHIPTQVYESEYEGVQYVANEVVSAIKAHISVTSHSGIFIFVISKISTP